MYLVVFQMGLYCFVCGFFVVIGNVQYDFFMFLIELFVIGDLLVVLCIGDNFGLGNGGDVMGLQKVCELWIVGGFGNGQMQGEIGFVDGFVCFDIGKDVGVIVEDVFFLRW